MSGSLNRVTIIGNLGRDPEVKTFQNGGKICNLRIATSENGKDKNTGERRERTEWHSVVIQPDGLVGIAERYLRKGSKVCIEGKLQTRKWQDQSGQDRYSTEIVVGAFGGSLVLLDKAEAGGRDDGGPADGNGYGSGYGAGGRPGGDIDDEIPFAPEVRA